MSDLKNSLRPNGDKQHDLGRDGIRWNKLWVGDIDSNGALLSQNYVYETTYAEQIEFQELLEVIFPPPPGPIFSISNDILVKMTGFKVATAVINSGLTYQFRLVVNGLEIPPSKTELAIVDSDSYIKFDGKLLGEPINIYDQNEANTRIVVWYVPDLSV